KVFSETGGRLHVLSVWHRGKPETNGRRRKPVLGPAAGNVSGPLPRAAGCLSGSTGGRQSQRHGGRDRANAHGVDHERIGQCDLRASAHRSRNPTTPTRLTPPGLGGRGDRRGAVARSGEASPADATARRNAP